MRNLLHVFVLFTAIVGFALSNCLMCHAQGTVAVTQGQSIGSLSEADLAAVGLVITGFSDDAPEAPGGGRIFVLNGTDDPVRPTTFQYTPSGESGLFPVSGRGEHSGSIFFGPNLLGINAVGGFSIGFDVNRVSEVNSGFFIESTEGLLEILFDIQAGDGIPISDPSQVMFSGALRVSPELNNLIPLPIDITGTVVGAWSFSGAVSGSAGDLNGDGDVDCDDLDDYIGNIGSSATGELAALDLVVDGTIDSADVEFLLETLVVTSNGQAGTFLGDLNCDGQVDVLGDAFILVGNLNSSVTRYGDGDINLDGSVTVLGDAFTIVGNLGMTNE